MPPLAKQMGALTLKQIFTRPIPSANIAKLHSLYPSPKQKALAVASAFCFGGGWWIRTTEVSDNRFTVCPLWPLGKSPKLTALNAVDGAGERSRTINLLITNQLLCH